MKKIQLFLVLILAGIWVSGQNSKQPANPLSTTSGMVAYYPFNGNAMDETGNGNDGSVSGATLTADRFGKIGSAYYFNGSSDFISTSNLATTAIDNWSITAWIKPATLNQLGSIVINGFDNGGSSNNGYSILLGDGGGGTGNKLTGLLSNVEWINPLLMLSSNNIWYHVAMVRKNGTTKLYLNGIAGSVTATAAPGTPLGYLRIGSQMGLRFFNGAIDEVKVFNKALSDAEVWQSYNSESSGLVAYYPFNGNSNDESGNGSNPTYIGTGVTLTSDRFGNPDKAYYFDGNADSYIRMPADNFPTEDRTISFWFNADQIENHPTPLSYGGDVCYNSFHMIINKGDYPNSYTVLSHCASNFISAPYSEAPINKWYNLTMTISGATQKIFINGELQMTTSTFTTPTVVAGKSAILGAILFTDGVTVYNEPTAGVFQGKMDDFRFYNTAMTDSEVKNLYNNESSGLVAYYPFNGNANDESGHGYNGSVSGATITTDRFNQPNKAYNLVYNGFSSDKIQVSGTSDLNFSTGGFSLSAWVQFSGLAAGGNNYPILSKHICGEQSGYILMLYNGKLTFWLGGSGSYNVVSTSDDYTDNSWHQVVAVYDGSTQYIYVDGALKKSMPFSYNSFNSANWALGGYNGCNGGFNGKVDEIKVFNQALTGSEIQNMYNKSAKDLVVFLPFNGNAIDESGNGHIGTVNGGVLTSDRNDNSNSAYTFPNSPDQIVLSNSADLNLLGGFTLNTWIKFKNADCHIISKHNCYTYNSFALAIYIGQIELFLGDGGGWNTVVTNETFTENQWYMVSAVYDSVNKTASIFINGLLKASGPANYTTPNNAPITISGATGSCPAINMPGSIDEVKIFNRPLSKEEIQSEYNSSFTGLVAFYPFSGNANDESGNNLHLTNNGAVPAADRFGAENNAYFLNGSANMSISDNDLLDITNDFSISYWVKNPGSVMHQFVMSKHNAGEDNSGSWGIASYDNGNTYTFVATPHWGFGPPNPTTPIITENKWHHITFTYKKATSEWKSFLDGSLSNSGTQDFNIQNTDRDFMIGTCMQYNSNLTAYLDDIRIYNYAIDDQQVIELYLAETKPVLQKPANQSSVTTLTPEMLWSSPLANAEFRFQLSSDSLFGSTLHELVTNNFSTQLPELLLAEGKNYYWRVQTTLNGETGPWSDVWSFNFVNTGISQQGKNIDFNLRPNPASANIKVTYLLKMQEDIRIELIDSQGKIVTGMVSKMQSAGKHEIDIETSSVKPGIYLCRITKGRNIQSTKVVIQH